MESKRRALNFHVKKKFREFRIESTIIAFEADRHIHLNWLIYSKQIKLSLLTKIPLWLQRAQDEENGDEPLLEEFKLLRRRIFHYHGEGIFPTHLLLQSLCYLMSLQRIFNSSIRQLFPSFVLHCKASRSRASIKFALDSYSLLPIPQWNFLNNLCRSHFGLYFYFLCNFLL